MPRPRSPPPGLGIQTLRMSPGWYVPSNSARRSRGRSDREKPSTSSTLRPSTPEAPLLRTTFSRDVARFAGDATASSSRLASAALAPRSLAVLLFAMCSRKSLPADASAGPDFPLPCGLAANTNCNWRNLMLQNPSPPSLHPLSRASSLLRGNPTSPLASSPRCFLLRLYRYWTTGDLLG